MTSRNKREGWYIGEIYGKHYRSKSSKYRKPSKWTALAILLQRSRVLDIHKLSKLPVW